MAYYIDFAGNEDDVFEHDGKLVNRLVYVYIEQKIFLLFAQQCVFFVSSATTDISTHS